MEGQFTQLLSLVFLLFDLRLYNLAHYRMSFPRTRGKTHPSERALSAIIFAHYRTSFPRTQGKTHPLERALS
jgi:hypothetical protein